MIILNIGNIISHLLFVGVVYRVAFLKKSDRSTEVD